MRILVLGAGAIGGYYGLHLAQAGADVSFLVRPGRAVQLERNGLVLQTRGEERRQPVRTLLAGGVDRPFDAVVLTCKAYDLTSALEAVAPAVGPASVVVPLLNGLTHLDALDARFGPARVLGGVAYIATTLGEDGTIRHASPTDTLLFVDRSGRITPPVQALAAAFAATPVAARASTDILQDLWEKWCMLAAGAALTCLMRGTVGEVMATDSGEAVAAAMIAETRSIAAGSGRAPRPEAAEQARRTLTDPQSRWAASMMRDIERGAPRVEAEHIVGDLIRRGRQVGVAAPLLEAAYVHLQIYSARGAVRRAGRSITMTRNNTALVTGASSGIGAAYAARLARRGHDLILVARDRARLEALAARLARDTGRRVEVLPADLTDAADLRRVEARLRADAAIAMLVNNAGMSASGTLAEADPDRLEAMVRLNTIAPMRLAAAAVSGFLARGGGTVVNIASVLALAPELFNGAYSGTKAFVLNLSQSLQQEVGGRGVRVQAVLPGATRTAIWEKVGVDTERFPAGMLMGAEEMVDAALAGLDQGEAVTIPSLPDAAEWERFNAARLAMGPNLSRDRAAGRYRQ